MKQEDIKNVIESVMFAYAEPISLKELKIILNDVSLSDIEHTLNLLKEEYEINNRGIKIIKLEEKYQMCTNDKYSSYIKKILQPTKKRL